MYKTRFWFIGLFSIVMISLASGCFHYSFKEGAIPKEIKTIRVNFIDNKARYINPQLSPQLTDKLRQKINNETGRTLISGDNADFDISGSITDYSFTTAGVSSSKSATNRLTVTVQIKLLNRIDPNQNKEETVSRNFDFDANISIQQAEAQLNESIIKNLTDEIYNRLFSNW